MHRLGLIVVLGMLLAVAPLRVEVHAQEAEATEEAPATPEGPPDPTSTVTVEGVTLDLLFERLPQGRAGLLRVSGGEIIEVRARFRNVTIPFFTVPEEPDVFYGLVAASMEQSPRTYELVVIAQREAGAPVTLEAAVEVTLGGFIRQSFDLPPDRGYLVSPEVERVEFSRLNSIFSVFTVEKLWDETGFIPPINSELTSPFGAFRTFNGTLETRHTGWDLRAPVGTPVVASASGRVAFAGLLDIRGNHIIIDHGFGIFTGYSHLSQVHVTRGQSVTAGQIIGVSGNSGRSSGAHLHWEVTVNGYWIDSADFMQMWLP